MYDVSPYVLSVCFDLETEQMWMLSVEYVGVFSDTSELNKSFSMQLTDGMTIKLFEKGTEIPDYRSHVVSPTDDGQHAIEIRVLQAQAGSDSDNELYAQYWVQQVPQGAKGAAKVEIRVEALIDGNLKMAALDMQARRELPVSVYP
jgi:molecular chaperone DnaK (HSP70)